MINNTESEFEKLISPILSDKDIWTNGNKLTIATFDLCRKAFSEGYSKEEIYQILSELYKRRESMMEDYIKQTGADYYL
ncbi:MAG: hypothetical protein K6G50_04975 [bacterium]|nr:hypothetical protein [bacterium]